MIFPFSVLTLSITTMELRGPTVGLVFISMTICVRSELVLEGVGTGVASMGRVYDGDMDNIIIKNISEEHLVAQQVCLFFCRQCL